MKNTLVATGSVALAVVVALWVVNVRVAKAPEAPVTVATTTTTVSTTIATTTTTGGGDGKACTMEAKLCPDGSAVGRTGPNCEFAPCPTVATTTPPTTILPYNSGVRGTVSLGPTCPVQRIPPDPQCADKSYATTIIVGYPVGGRVALSAEGKSDASGKFEFSLPPGSYILIAGDLGAKLPRCNPVNVTVVATGYVTSDISCDTGIR